MVERVTRLRAAAIERVLDGPAIATLDARRAAFDNRDVPEPARALVDKVARNAWKVTDEDIAAVKAARLCEDEIFELAIAAALGQATRQLESASAALAAALGEPAPAGPQTAAPNTATAQAAAPEAAAAQAATAQAATAQAAAADAAAPPSAAEAPGSEVAAP